MDLNQIKVQLGVTNLTVAPAKKKDGTATDWMRSWDNNSRVQVSVHKDTVAQIKANSAINLGLQTETKTSATSQLEYTAHRIVAYKEVEGQVVL